MKLRYRIALFAVATALLPVFITSIRAVSIATTEASRASEQILIRDADAMVSFSDSWLASQTRAVAGLLQLFRVEQAPQAELDNLVLAAFLAVPTVQIAVMVDADGAEMVSPTYLEAAASSDSPLAGRAPGSIARADVLVASLPLSEALAGRSTVATAVVGSVYEMEGVIAVPVAATGPYQEDVVLGAEVSLAELEAEFEARTTPTHGVALLDASGAPVVGRGHPLIDTALLAPVLRSRATVSYRLSDGTEVRGAVAPLAEHPWTVVVVEPAVVAERAGIEIRRRTLWTGLFTALIAVGIGVLVARSLTRPIDRLREFALAVADGELGRRLLVQRSDEIGDLGHAFNHMSTRLEENRVAIADQQREIQAFNEELQQRVSEATDELRAAQEQLVRSGQLAAVTDVSAGLAHELNNPLAGILGLAQLLAAKAGEDAPLAARIEEQAERCREVVAAMTRLSVHETGPLVGDVVDLRHVLDDVLVVARVALRQRGVTVTQSKTSESARVAIDTGFAVRALSPVFSTLAAALPAGSSVLVHTQVRAGRVEVLLSADQPIAADAFSDDRRASGLKLWVSRQLLSAVGGTLHTPEAPAPAWVVTLPEAS